MTPFPIASPFWLPPHNAVPISHPVWVPDHPLGPPLQPENHSVEQLPPKIPDFTSHNSSTGQTPRDHGVQEGKLSQHAQGHPKGAEPGMGSRFPAPPAQEDLSGRRQRFLCSWAWTPHQTFCSLSAWPSSEGQIPRMAGEGRSSNGAAGLSLLGLLGPRSSEWGAAFLQSEV